MSNEPSMEDILSSIKRIIAEDSDAALSAPRGRRSVAGASGERGIVPPPSPADHSEVLELTEAVPADDSGTPTQSHNDHAAPGGQPATETPSTETKAPLVSDAALNASRSSIAALSALIIKPEVTGGDTLEGLVREMLKPMLADWLDQRLPDVVERLVAQEISRITARG
jgi:cell pole-organizing protein PopZ